MAVVNENSAGSVLALQAEVRRLREELASVSGSAHPVALGAHSAGKFDRLMELEVLLSKSLDDNDELRQDKGQLEERIMCLKTLCERKDNFVMNTKMVVRLREAQIAKLETVYENDDIIPPRTADEEELRDEVKALRSIVDLHPEVTRFAMENLELRDDIAKLDSISFHFMHALNILLTQIYMSDADAQIADLKNHIHDLSAQLNTVLKEKHDLMKGDSDKEKTETIMALRLKLDSQTMDLEEKNEYITFLSAEVERVKGELIANEQMHQQAMKEMAQKEQDIQDMMTLADEAFQQKNGSSERIWAAKLQKMQDDYKDRDAARQSELAAKDDIIAKLRTELGQVHVANRRLSSHFSFPSSPVAHDFPPSSPRTPTRESLREQQTRDLQSKVDSLMEELAQIREERDTLADEIRFLSDREHEQKDRNQSPDSYDPTEIQSLKGKIEELIAENKEYSLMMDKYSELQSQAFQYHIERDEMEEAHKTKVGQLESEIRRFKTLLAEKEAHAVGTEQKLGEDAKVLELETECAHLRSRLMDAEQSRISEQSTAEIGAEQSDELKQALEAKEGQVSALAEELAVARSALASEQCSVTQMQQTIKAQMGERESLLAEIADKTRTLEAHGATVKDLQESERALLEFEAECLSLRTACTQTKEERDHIEVERARLVTELEAKQVQYDAAQGRIRDLEQECKQLQEDIESANELDLSNMYQRQLKKAQQEQETLQHKATEAEEQATRAEERAVETERTLQDEIRMSKEQNERDQLLLQQVNAELCVLTNEAHLLRSERAKVQEELGACLAELCSHRDTVRRLEEEAHEHSMLLEQADAQINELTLERNSIIAAAELERSESNQDEELQLRQQIEAATTSLATANAELASALARLAESDKLIKDNETQASVRIHSLETEKQALVEECIPLMSYNYITHLTSIRYKRN